MTATLHTEGINNSEVFDSNAIVQTMHLTKTYGKNRGIEDINLLLYPGEAFGFLGPNGAGKTTTIRCLLDILRPTSGASYLFGTKVSGKSAYLRSCVGYVAGEVRLMPSQTGMEQVRLAEGLRGEKARHVKELSNRFELDLSRKTRTLSKGNKQKLALLLAFMFDNQLFILDEPTSGLDPLNQQLVFQLIEERRNAGATVLLSSHILSEVEQSCNRVGVVSAGRLLTQESMQGLIDKQLRHIRIVFADAQAIDPSFWPTLTTLQNPQWETNNVLSAGLKPDAINEFIAQISQCTIVDLEISKSSLEEVFMDYYDINQSNVRVSSAQMASLKERGVL